MGNELTHINYYSLKGNTSSLCLIQKENVGTESLLSGPLMSMNDNKRCAPLT